MDEKTRIIEGYEVRHAVRLAGAEVILAENKNTAEPYMVCDCTSNNPFNADEYYNAVVSADYLEIMREFTRRLAGRVESLETERSESGIPFEMLTAADCKPNSMETDLEGQVIVIKGERLAPEYRTGIGQLEYCTGGFGARPEARGRAVYCTNLYDGKSSRYDRSDVAGIILPECMPEWAKEKLAALQKPAEKESVVEKIRQGNRATKQETSPNKKRGKGEPEH